MKKKEACPPQFHEFEDMLEGHHIKNIEVMRAFHRIRRVNISLLLEVAPGEFYVLQIIARYKQQHPEREGIYVSQIAEKANMVSSQVSRMLRGMEERGLIGRSVDALDRRNTYVFLTEEGEATCLRTKERMEHYTSRVMESIGEERVNKLIQLCNEMAEVMEKELENEQSRYNDRKDEDKNGKDI